jgi:hypothetical protein
VNLGRPLEAKGVNLGRPQEAKGVNLGRPQAPTDMAFSGAPDPSIPPSSVRDPDRQHGRRSGSRLVAVLGERSAVTVDGSIEDRMAALARLQRGRVSRGQLLYAGLQSSAIGWLLHERRLLPVHRAVYVVGHDAPTPLGPQTAALLAVRDGALLSHHSAAELWGWGRTDVVIHVTVRGSPGGEPEGVLVHRSGLLANRDLRLRHGLPVTSPARTLLDRAQTASARDLERMLDQGLVERILTVRDVARSFVAAGATGDATPCRACSNTTRPPPSPVRRPRSSSCPSSELRSCPSR